MWPLKAHKNRSVHCTSLGVQCQNVPHQEFSLYLSEVLWRLKVLKGKSFSLTEWEKFLANITHKTRILINVFLRVSEQYPQGSEKKAVYLFMTSTISSWGSNFPSSLAPWVLRAQALTNKFWHISVQMDLQIIALFSWLHGTCSQFKNGYLQ